MMDQQQQGEFCANCSAPLIRIKENEGGTHPWLKDREDREQQQQQTFVEISIRNEQEVPGSFFDHDDNLDMTVYSDHQLATTTKIKVNRVLSSIYKLDYLHQLTGTSEQENIAVCRQCADKLAQLYKIYNEFNELRRRDSYLARQLADLDVMMRSHPHYHHNNNSSSISENETPREEYSSEIETSDYDTCDNLQTRDTNIFEHTNELDLIHVCEISNTVEIECSTNVNTQQMISTTSPPWVNLVGLTSKETINPEASQPPKTMGVKISSQQKQSEKEPTTAPEPFGCEFLELDPDILSSIINDEIGDDDFDPGKEIKAEFDMDSDHDHDDSSKPTGGSQKRKSRTKNPGEKKSRRQNQIKRRGKGYSEARPYQCQQCSKTYKSSDGLHQHSFVHTGDRKPYKCPLCSIGFRNPSQRNEHLSTVHKDEPTPTKDNKCSHDGCEEAFFSSAELDRHVRKCHTDPEKLRSFSCALCPRKFMYEGSLKGHIRAIHLGENCVTCTVCSKQLRDTSTLKAHMLIVHPQKLFPCSHCGGSFRTENILKRHVAVHHTNEKPYKCDQCDQSCYTKCDLQRHIANRHSAQKQFQCSRCEKSFALESSMRRHEQMHSQPRSYLCTACGKAFQTPSLLDRHFYLLHRDERQHKCSVCSMTFKLRQTKERHELIHGEKTKICTFCGKAFAQAAGLRRHLLTHTGEKPYKCSLCPAAFPDNRPLKKHMLTHQSSK